jgi:beta-1,4-mannooligosaccharide/beta-1,4-mannosyl-N-acetylglucosamine phosphorylase
LKIPSPSLPNLPWEPRPDDCADVVWRSKRNPILGRRILPDSNSIFNSAVVPFGDGFAGVFRIDNRNMEMRIHAGFSEDGINWRIDPNPITFTPDSDVPGPFVYGYDPRVTKIGDRYYVTWCNGYHGPTIGVAWTTDFTSFHQKENVFVPFNRNGVLFPRKIKGRFALLNRPSDNGHTPFGDIFYCESPDLEFWGRHRHVMSPVKIEKGWQSTKVGAGAVPIETDEGWLLLYHGVQTSCNGYVYSMGAALLDLEEPWKVIGRAQPFLLAPWETYEMVGDVPNVVFPCAALVDGDSGRMAIYYGGADTVTCMAFAYVSEVVDFIKANPEPNG